MTLYNLCLLSINLLLVQGCTNSGPLGMITGEIKDWQITASSSYPSEWDEGCHVKYARPYLKNKLGWCSHIKSTSEWLQVDIGYVTSVTAILTQGRGDGSEWVTSFLVSYSIDGEKWNYIVEENGETRVFKANSDSYTVEHVYLPSPIHARFVKIQVQSWNKHPSMRVEVIGCKDNRQQLAQPPYGNLQASTSHSYKKGSSCQPTDGHLLSNKAWCAGSNNENQWLQLDVGPPTLITALVTKGRGDTGRKQWVTRYKVSYSNDTKIWTFYKDSLTLESKYIGRVLKTKHEKNIELPSRVNKDGVVEFGGNADKHTERVHYLAHPITARYIRFHPIQWHRHIAMRAGVLGRIHTGECGPGFTRPNAESACVENIAFKKETWLNKERHKKRALSGTREDINQKLAEKAVDGNITNDINSCTILDNYYDKEPQLTIDLGSRRDVSGVVIYMWEGNKDKSTTYNKDYSLKLEALSVYVSSGKTGETLCGRIQNHDNKLGMKREHKLICSRRLDGRYIRVQPEGRAGWYTNWYSAVICEVMAFT